MPLSKEKPFSVAYIESLPEGQRAELIDGYVYDLAAPSTTHQRISMLFSREISNYIDSHHGDCSVFAAPFAVYLNDDDYNYVEPDISVICDKSKLDETGCHGAPDWIVEIVSPASRKMDNMIKLFKYRSAGVKEYWIVDPDEKTIKVFDFAAEDYGNYAFTDSVPIGLYPGFEIQIEK